MLKRDAGECIGLHMLHIACRPAQEQQTRARLSLLEEAQDRAASETAIPRDSSWAISRVSALCAAAIETELPPLPRVLNQPVTLSDIMATYPAVEVINTPSQTFRV